MSEAAVSYAALILADSEIEISSDKLIALTSAAGANVEQVWADIYAKALEGKDLKELVFSLAASAPAASAPAASAGAAAAAASGESAAAAEEEAAEEEAEESDADMGFGLFD